MTLLPDSQIALAETGASLLVDARKLNQHQLQRLAAAVAEAGGKLTIINATSLAPQLAQALAAVGGKQVCFDLTD